MVTQRLALFDLPAGLAISSKRRCVGAQPLFNTRAWAVSKCCASKLCRQILTKTSSFSQPGAACLYLRAARGVAHPKDAASAGGASRALEDERRAELEELSQAPPPALLKPPLHPSWLCSSSLILFPRPHSYIRSPRASDKIPQGAGVTGELVFC